MAHILVIPIILFLLILSKKVLKIFYIPSLISMVILGILFGPAGYNFIESFMNFIGQPEKFQLINNSIESFSLLGMVYLMVQAGLESDLRFFKPVKREIIILTILTVILPLLGVIAVSLKFNLKIAEAVLLAAVFISRSIGAVMDESGFNKVNNAKLWAILTGTTEITNFVCMVLLIAALQLQQIEGSSLLVNNISIIRKLYLLNNKMLIMIVFLLIVLVYLYLCLILIPGVLKNIFARLNKIRINSIMIIIIILLFFCFTSELIGINLLIGAYIAGLFLSQTGLAFSPGEGKNIFTRLGYWIFLPFIFFYIGSGTQFQYFLQLNNLFFFLLIFTGMVITKFIAGFPVFKFSNFNGIKSLYGGIAGVSHLAFTLIIAQIGKEAGIINTEIFTSIVTVCIITSIFVPVILKMIMQRNPKIIKSLDSVNFDKSIFEKNII